VGKPRPGDPSSSPANVLRKLQAVTDAALAHLTLDDLLDELLTRVRDALEADTCAVLLLDERSQELVARAAKGLEEEVEQGVRIPVGKGFAGRISATRQPVVIDDVEHADLVNPILREKGLRSLLGVPLLVEGDVLGVIHVGTLHPRAFRAQDVELLQTVADRVARAIDRALLFNEIVRLNELQRDFVSLAAHELRTPAAALYGLTATLKERRDQLDDAVVLEIEDTLYEQADRMRRLVDQLLDLSRLEARTVEIKRAPVALRPQLEKIVHEVTQGSTDVEIDVPRDLAATIDLAAVEHVVANLLTNALRYGAPPITVRAERKDRHVRIAVEDCGEGVREDFIPFLFERFRRSETSRGRPTGSGLGLAIARSYAQAHGGDLIYDPTGRGACFELVIPIEPTNG
jgi:signal transduction histidine kinase